MAAPLLKVSRLRKVYSRGLWTRQETFRLEADFTIAEPAIVGMMGPNGSGKTTLFELITGSNRPTSGRVHCCGQNIHEVKYRERDRLAIHYHQSYQVRHFKRSKPSFLMEPAGSDYPMIHLFDEPSQGLAPKIAQDVMKTIGRLKQEGLSVLVVEQNATSALQVSDRVYVMDLGRIVHEGPARDLL